MGDRLSDDRHPLDWLGGRPPRFDALWGHWRTGFDQGRDLWRAVHGPHPDCRADSAPARRRSASLSGFALIAGPLLGAFLFPLAATRGRQRRRHAAVLRPAAARLSRSARAGARARSSDSAWRSPIEADLAAFDGGARFLSLFVVGALAYGGVDLAFDACGRGFGQACARSRRGGSTRSALLLGGIVAGALGWYFDAAQIQVVVAKFWAYASSIIAPTAGRLGDFTTYPIFNKYGSVNLGADRGRRPAVLGRVGRGRDQLVARRAPVLDQLCAARRDAAPEPCGRSATCSAPRGSRAWSSRACGCCAGASGWRRSSIRSCASRRTRPGTIRTARCARRWRSEPNVTQSPADFRRFSLRSSWASSPTTGCASSSGSTIWACRVASLVNLSFLGGDRADEAAARFIGHKGRTRAIPDGIRRFGTWAPLLIPFYIPRGGEWDQAWTGAETLATGAAPMPGPVRSLAFAYGAAVAVDRSRVLAAVVRSRDAKGRAAAPGSRARRSNSARRPDRFTSQQRRGRRSRSGATAAAPPSCWAPSGAGRRSIFYRRPLDPAAGARPFFLCERGRRGALVDRLGAGAAAPATTGSRSPASTAFAIVHELQRDRGADGDRARSATGRDPLVAHSPRPTRPGGRDSCASRASARSRRHDTGRLRPRSRLRRHACRDDFRARAEHDSSRATACCARRARIAAKPRSLRSSPARASNLSATRIRASRFIGEGSLSAPTGMRAVALAQAR